MRLNKPFAFRQHVICFFSLCRQMASDSLRMLKLTTMRLKVLSQNSHFLFWNLLTESFESVQELIVVLSPLRDFLFNNICFNWFLIQSKAQLLANYAQIGCWVSVKVRWDGLGCVSLIQHLGKWMSFNNGTENAYCVNVYKKRWLSQLNCGRTAQMYFSSALWNYERVIEFEEDARCSWSRCENHTHNFDRNQSHRMCF